MKLKLATTTDNKIVLMTAIGDIIEGVISVKLDVEAGKEPIIVIELAKYEVDIKK